MSDKPRWMDYLDLAIKVAVPVTVLFATFWFNHSADERREKNQAAETTAKRRQECFDNQFRLTTFVCEGQDCVPINRRANQLIVLSGITGQVCREANVQVQAPLAADVSAALVSGGNSRQAVQAAVSLGLATRNLQQPVGDERAPRQEPATTVGGTLAPRIYIQIAQPEQAAGARQLIDRLARAEFEGQAIRGIDPELVRSTVSRTQLRCMKVEDCRNVTRLAALLSVLLGETVHPVDLSARYGNSNSRPNHFELWFAPGPINVVGGS